MTKWLVAAASITLVVGTARAPAGEPDRESDLHPVLLRPALARTLSRPFLPLLIDVMWLRSINAIGLKDSARKNRGLYEYGRAITDLDPRFYEVYKFMGLTVPFQVAPRVYAHGELAEDLLRKGLRQFPVSVPLHIYLGYNLFEMQQKYREASEVFESLGRIEGAPAWARPLAARLLSHDGSPREALALTELLLRDAPDEETRTYLEGMRSQLQIEVQLHEVDQAIEAFRQRKGVGPRSIDELIAEGLYHTRTDVTGGELYIGLDGRSASTNLARRVKLYQ